VTDAGAASTRIGRKIGHRRGVKAGSGGCGVSRGNGRWGRARVMLVAVAA